MLRRTQTALLVASGTVAALTALTAFLACSSDLEPAAAGPGDAGPGNGGDGSSTPVDPTTQRGSPRVYADALCGYYEKCDPVLLNRSFGGLESCKAQMLVRTTDSLNASGNVVTQATLEACTSKLGLASCADQLGSLAECDFRGTNDDGATCLYSGQCKGGACNLQLTDAGTYTACGLCAERRGEGADCRAADCQIGLFCASDVKCHPVGKLGDPCDTTRPCPTHLLCSSGGICSKPLTAGSTCDSRAVRNPCDGTKGESCVNGVCKALVYAKPGEHCGYDASGASYSECMGGFCTDAGVCEAFHAAGAPCPLNRECATFLRCEEGVCKRHEAAMCR